MIFFKKWEIENNKLPKNQRRNTPQKPQILPSINQKNTTDRDRFNQAAYESAQSQLIACRFCNRSFATDRVGTHEKICQQNNSNTPSKIPTRVSRPGYLFSFFLI